MLGRCKKLVEHFHKSTQATYALREKQKLLSDDQTLELVQLYNKMGIHLPDAETN